MLMLDGIGFWTAMRPLLTPWWQQGLASVRRLAKTLGARA